VLHKPKNRKDCYIKIVADGYESTKLLYDDIKNLKVGTIFKDKLVY
jgi:hypothetical protein